MNINSFKIFIIAIAAGTVVAGSLSQQSNITQSDEIAENRKTITMSGDYTWIQEPEQKSPLQAVFTLKGKDQYHVSFYLVLGGENRVYSGEAKGNLINGAVKGQVQNEVKDSTYRFEAASASGVLQGNHVEIIKDGSTIPTGTIVLKMVKKP